MIVRLLRFAGLLSLVGVAACIDVSFGADGTSGTDGTASSTGGASTVDSGSSVTTGGGGSGGSSTVTSTTTGGGDCANKRCGDDGMGGLCNGKVMQPMWAASALADEPRQIITWPETQSLIVTTSNDRVLRYDECDGSLMAEIDAISAGTRPYLMGAGLFGNQVRIIGASTISGTNPNRLYAIDASQPSSFGAPVETVLSGQFTTKIGGAFADASGIYANLTGTAQGLVPAVGTSCTTTASGPGNSYSEARGVLHTADGVYVSKWSSNQLIGVIAACPDACTCPSPATRTANGTVINALVDGNGEVISIGVNQMTDARFSRLDPQTLTEHDVINLNIDGSGQDALLTGVAGGGFVFAGGATALASGTAAYSHDPTGEAVLVSLPMSFNGSTTPTSQVLAGGQRVRILATDDSGLYVGGLAVGGSSTSGFLIKCTPELGCVDIP